MYNVKFIYSFKILQLNTHQNVIMTDMLNSNIPSARWKLNSNYGCECKNICAWNVTEHTSIDKLLNQSVCLFVRSNRFSNGYSQQYAYNHVILLQAKIKKRMRNYSKMWRYIFISNSSNITLISIDFFFFF